MQAADKHITNTQGGFGRPERSCMCKILFDVPGRPQGKARARTVHKSSKTMSFTPDNTVLYENLIKTCYMAASKKIYENKEPLRIHITAYFSPPLSTSKKRRSRMLSGAEYPVKKPDADNIAKVVCDALNGVAYLDDVQVCDLNVEKKYGPTAKVSVEIESIGGDGLA